MSVNGKMTAIADAIREKTGESGTLTLDAMAAAIAALEVGGGSAVAAYGSVTPAETGQVQIAHGLGKTPDFFVVNATSNVSSSDFEAYDIYTISSVQVYAGSCKGLHVTHWNGTTLKSTFHYTHDAIHVTEKLLGSFDETYMTIGGTEGASSPIYSLAGGVTYVWLAGCYE